MRSTPGVDARPRAATVVRLAASALALNLLACSPGAGATEPATTSGDASSGSEGGTLTGSAVTTASDETTATPTSSGTTAQSPDLPPTRACNGHASLCERRFDEVAFPCTHNAYAASDEGFAQLTANQKFGVAQQLTDGVRCMMLDVRDNAGETVLCHGNCLFGQLNHLEVLQDIAAFLDANHDEVLTIIYEDALPVAPIVADLEASGLAARVYTHTAGEPWPTLAAMIDADTRLLISAENGAPPPMWFHHVWDLTWDTPYTFHGIDEFTCELNRGMTGNDLFLVNHWVSTEFDTPSAADAPAANAYDVLHARAAQCQRESGQLPNFLAVDFYDKGDLFAAVRALNGLP
jgi:hypothetical protein